ncbi:YgjV family protein [Vibrio rarus]|uniref:YgjV family protein n=1 Tax=Vibrio rarus TaxID=413403 RepID=UPI0021C3181A|nr:YgjV family protein [Vibrio rarus]
MSELHFWGQVLGFVSFAIGVSTFYQKDDKRLKIMMAIFNVNHMVHYLMLGSLMSALSSVLSASRTTAAIFTSSKYVAYIFIFLSAVLGYLLADSWLDVWPILGSAIGTYSVFLLKGIAMRCGFLFGAACWLTNNIIVGSIGGTLLEVTLICFNLFTIYRLYLDGKALSTQNEQG